MSVELSDEREALLTAAEERIAGAVARRAEARRLVAVAVRGGFDRDGTLKSFRVHEIQRELEESEAEVERARAERDALRLQLHAEQLRQLRHRAMVAAVAAQAVLGQRMRRAVEGREQRRPRLLGRWLRRR